MGIKVINSDTDSCHYASYINALEFIKRNPDFASFDLRRLKETVKKF